MELYSVGSFLLSVLNSFSFVDLLSTYYDRIVMEDSRPQDDDQATSTPSYAESRDGEANGLVLPALALLNIVFSLI